MSITGTYILEDLISGAWLHARRRLLVAGALGALLLLSLLNARSGLEELGASLYGWALWALSAAMLYFALLVFVAIPYKCRRELAQRKDLQRALTLSPSDAALGMTTEVLSITRPWSDYCKWMEGRKVFVLFLSDSVFQVIPKRFFASDSDVEVFRELLKRSVRAREV